LRHDFDAAGIAIPGGELLIGDAGPAARRGQWCADKVGVAPVALTRNSHSSIAGHDSASVNAGIDIPPIALRSSFDYGGSHKVHFGRPEMSGLSDREKAFENKFALDQELKFKALARRNKLAGLWAAGLLGKTDADAYAKEVVVADFEEAGDEDVFRKLRGDLDAGGVSISDQDIRTKMVELLAQAVEQIENQ
jgi:hypothetical protein